MANEVKGPILGTVLLAGVNSAGQPARIDQSALVAGMGSDGVPRWLLVDSSGSVLSSGGLALGSTPSTQAFGDAASGGSDVTASKNDHKHGFPSVAPFQFHSIVLHSSIDDTMKVQPINSASYVTTATRHFHWDFDILPKPTSFRIFTFAQSTEGGQTVTMEMRNAAGTAYHTGGNDLVITNSLTTHDSGWKTIDIVQAGVGVFTIAIKGSNATVDYTHNYLAVLLK